MTEEQSTPEDRAEAAARDLADRGLAVTARAVRDTAGVRMAVAAEAARAWREAAVDQREVQVPDMPEDVRGRLTAIWADSYRAAHAAVSPERDQLAAIAKELRAEIEALTAAVSEVEEARDSAIKERDLARDSQRAAEDRLREAHESLSSRDASMQEAREQNNELLTRLSDLIKRIPDTNETQEEDQ